jgi:serine/threonine protein kinase
MRKLSQNAVNSIGYVHRDIKPDNIFIVFGGPDIVGCKLIDFGITKKIGDEFNTSGTPIYTPPDMILNDDTRTAMGISSSNPRYSGKIIKRHNDYSVDVIWNYDFGMEGLPTPNCAMRGGRRCRRSKTRRSKKRKSKTRRI